MVHVSDGAGVRTSRTHDTHRHARGVKSKAEVVQGWTETRARIEAMPLLANVGALVDRAAALFGDRIAWHFFERNERLSFRDAQALSLRAAGLFRERGVGRGDSVGVMVENGPAYLGAWLGLARLGAAIVPINPRYTPRELQYVLKASRALFLVIDADLLPRFDEIAATLEAPFTGQVLVVGGTDPGVDWAAALAKAAPLRTGDDQAGADDIMNIQYTSGTTGFPKGCMVPQRLWLNAALTWGEYLRVPVGNVICNQRLFYQDGQFNAMMCLYKGSTYYICSRPSAANFSKWLFDFKINDCFYFDPLFKVEPGIHDAESALNLITIFGFSAENHALLERRYGAIAREAYGMSEFAPSLIMPLDADVMVGSASCGLVAPFTEAKVVDDAGAVVPNGEVGELCVRSHAMMTGYFGDPVATSETIVEGWLKTGDLFRQDEHGFFYIVGRKKDMVRRNAENIACREVEEVVRMMPEILEVAMVPVKDATVGEEPKIYVQLRAGETRESVPPERILAFCAEYLAPFKLPRYIAYVPAFTMTDSARVEKKTLIAGVADLRANSFD